MQVGSCIPLQVSLAPPAPLKGLPRRPSCPIAAGELCPHCPWVPLDSGAVIRTLGAWDTLTL